MSESFNLEVPEFASLFRAPCDPNGVCNDCCNLFSTLGANLGVLNTPVNPTPNCVCHDVCVEDVTLICATPITRTLDYPPVGRCRLGGVSLPALSPSTPCNVFVSCADEALGPTCSSVIVTLGLLIVCGNVVVPTCFSVTCNTFIDFPTGTAVSGTTLRDRIKEIDGSCLTIQVNAVTNADGSQIIISGKIIDKLWKHENLWIQGIRPYDLSDVERANGFISITVKQDFGGGQGIPGCNSFICPSCSG